ncbi:hypothetical protein L1987_01387 [Smallanthus sonchifolius]|uniref:Uncharacterized protein n=1 Tax=Smallanthus sonchifolius TaxID=185202 RepID=A0ACB9K539_9ASTR|nr:hypothetical protein L1987_01387 [Smallanthus sonchifolius]
MTTLESICNVIFYVIAGVVAIGFTVYAKKALKGLENEDNMETDDVFDSDQWHHHRPLITVFLPLFLNHGTMTYF